MRTDGEKEREELGRGEFFAIDARAWDCVCRLGSMNAAVAYLVLARGTLRGVRTTFLVSSSHRRTNRPSLDAMQRCYTRVGSSQNNPSGQGWRAEKTGILHIAARTYSRL